jgi:hypothetical protein
MQSMTMYEDFLTRALEGWTTHLTGSALVDYAVACRIDMLDHGSRRGDSAYDVLAVEVVYDRALISLCGEYDIEIVLASFADPKAARSRLEHELAGAGIDLVTRTKDAREAQS